MIFSLSSCIYAFITGMILSIVFLFLLNTKTLYSVIHPGKIGVNGTAYRSNRNTYRLKRYTFPHIINLYFYCFPPFAILMM